jgi:diguanylate cyclase (GGDEF)-like protein/PAS domain S-box-containing protein
MLRPGSSIWVSGLIVALVLGFCAVAVVMLAQLRRDAKSQAMTAAGNLLTAVSQDIGRNIDLYDLSLQSVVDGLRLPGLDQLSPDMQQAVLFDRSATAEYLGAILIVDEHGEVVEEAGTIPARHDNIGDRPWFQLHRSQPDLGLHVSAPFRRRSRGNGELGIALSRRINHPDGSFAGIVVGTLRLEYFHDLFKRLHLGPMDSMNLFNIDGVVIMRSPYDQAQIGRDLSSSSNVQRFKRMGAGSFVGDVAFDGVRRVYSFTHVGTLPLMVSLGLSAVDIYASWWSWAAVIGTVLLALCAATGGLGLLLQRELQRRARAERQARTSEAQYRMLADHANDVIVRLANDMTRLYVSPASYSVFGYVAEELVGQLPSSTIHADDWQHALPRIRNAQRTTGHCEVTYRFRHKDGHFIWTEAHYNCMPDDSGFIVVLRDISKRKRAEEQLEAANTELLHLASMDGLTGLFNRRRFDEAIGSEWRRAAREKRSLSLLLLDVDRFKSFNDQYGHQEGDACLRAVAKAIEGCVGRPADLVARYGGEEFVVLLPGTNGSGAEKLGEQIRAAIAALGLVHEGNPAHGGVVTASIGSATCVPTTNRDDASSTLTDPSALIVAADQALYEAKRSGRNRLVSHEQFAAMQVSEGSPISA